MINAHGEKRSKIGSIAIAIVTILVVALVAYFVWRVMYYVQAIKSGTLTQTDLSFLQDQSLSGKLASMPVQEAQADVLSKDDPSLGSINAPVTIVVFGDFSCSFSREAGFTMRSLLTKYPKTIHFVFRDFPIAELHPQATLAAEAAACAAEQGRFWEYHDKLYANQSDLRRERLIQFARELSLAERPFTRCLDQGKYKEEVQEDYNAGVVAGVRGTPTFFINGQRVPGAIPESTLDKLIQGFVENNTAL